MRVPRGVANFNRRVTNPVARSLTPWLPGLGTLEHTGRKSGKRYRTPLLVFPTRDGFAFLVGYGPQTDWVKNVLAGGPTVLNKRGKAIELGDPKLVSKAEAVDVVTPGSRPFYRLWPYNEAALLLTRVA
ncbi:deazaflavin-dependent oxidoreductase, nitroreductase family protein [Mycolicibacterium hassiacum DSM 44199]|jgi:deazaflavin-dependent oxidoreductase (nitroreductase family)|uniref:Deazaflavin-dependent oxidoreductase, nitroreductase family protein n=1 Tax=Mycolicibacterium hassiacum (strain DSM 44199 / CIP 105218 / JCM 12690 / 3849) TaxID=1122247 RepID=K5BFM5_MYCHD|nr:nitroreductase family deazaflavin-dependent oxidoreductase [Mycolicibacterium hassiacum]EKF23256.1 deazaflavin-dependent oxidoreductase, nitroreductase family protein [Mycolicibacterium hassiacum DSM 44199]MBX5488928.1 nitroreductase family deazaflavin-dependent oxidoreductase [Mycolicibacterium hassiacum]MDA4086474.1 peptidase [Mycolicibacterium hassiacum DSM 44199]PZN19409.1 MAG: nitroreductase family deazaflavin-dependent oxidoreductase [Mycolicibacterium hassiacum]VCT89721.1 hypothetica